MITVLNDCKFTMITLLYLSQLSQMTYEVAKK